MRVTIEVNSVHKLYVVYSMSRDDVIIYVGLCKWSQLLHTPDARLNSGFRHLSGSVVLEVLDYFASKKEAMRYQSASVNALAPSLNLMGKRVSANRNVITCLNDGMSYTSLYDAARAYDLTPGAISNHLAGRAGYDTVHGKRFAKGAPI